MLFRLTGVMARESRKDHGRQRDAEHAQRKFHEPVRVVQPRHAAGDEEGRNLRVEQQADLRYRRTEHAGQHQLADAPHAFGGRAPSRPAEQTEPHHRGHLETELQQAADEHAHGQRHAGILRVRGDPQRHDDHDHVHDHLRVCGQRELAVAVENAGEQRAQRDEEQVRKRPAQHRRRQVPLVGLVVPARRKRQDDERRADDP